jgi:hypothetical protein
MENTTSPMFSLFVTQAYEELSKQHPDMSPDNLMEQALELAYERWDSYVESQHYKG